MSVCVWRWMAIRGRNSERTVTCGRDKERPLPSGKGQIPQDGIDGDVEPL
jgi:hypothetical protein